MTDHSSQTVTELPWDDTTFTIKGKNAGIKHLTALYDGDELSIIDFLNNSLTAQYALHYETIMSKYESKLKDETILDRAFPEPALACQKLDPARYTSDTPAPDKELIETLLKEYHTCLDYIKTHFKPYEAHVDRWFNSLPGEDKKV
jgi:hypothetical protein